MRVNKSACGCLSTCPQRPPEGGIDDNDINDIYLVHIDFDDIDVDSDTEIHANEMVSFYEADVYWSPEDRFTSLCNSLPSTTLYLSCLLLELPSSLQEV